MGGTHRQHREEPMAKAFPGYSKKALTFLRALARNNDRDWFQANKQTYADEVRGPTVELVEAVNGALARFAPEYVAVAAKAVPRVNRDIRFSADKSPYKTNVSAVFPCNGGSREGSAGFYFSLSPKGLEVLAGAYRPGTEPLAALRSHLAAEAAAFRRLIKRPKLVELMGRLQGERLERAPKGWPVDHPAIDLLRHKQLYVGTRLPLATATSPGVLKALTDRFRAATPFVRFLDEGLSARAGR
jgi:uncharacterized protein (TIGR02453 family)